MTPEKNDTVHTIIYMYVFIERGTTTVYSQKWFSLENELSKNKQKCLSANFGAILYVFTYAIRIKKNIGEMFI